VASDSAIFRVAPFQLASSLDPVELVLVVKNRLTANFIPALKALLTRIGVPLQVIAPEDDTLSDVWMQDTVEIGRYVVPGKAGPQQVVGVLAGLRAEHDGMDCKPLDHAVRAHFLAQNAVLIEAAARPNTRWIDWYGNLEVSPPVKSLAGRVFPLGRVLVGKQRELEMHPDILRFLEAQGAQTPAITVDTSWLEVGHVDEVINFVPAPNEPGFRVLLPSPARARAILASMAERAPQCPVFVGTEAEMSTISLLNEVAESDENISIQQILDDTQRMLCTELGIDENDFITIPALFREGQAVIPNCVNCLVVNNHVILPEPKGPVVDGRDAFAAPIRVAFEALGLSVHFIDNWEPYHVRAGEVHCGTNAVRRVRISL
jgi:protein-arginine deiminase